MAVTYESLATTTLGSATASVSFTSISANYTDLVVVLRGTADTSANALTFTFNNDTGANYYDGYIYADSGGAGRGIHNATTKTFGSVIANTNQTVNTLHIQNYSNTSIGKSFLVRGSHEGTVTIVFAGYWSSTSALNRIDIGVNNGANLNAGFTATIFGIKRA